MDEWTVVTALVVIVGLFSTVAVPIIKQTKTMTKLDETIRHLSEKLTDLEINNTEAHRRIWAHNDKQDERIDNHEIRIVKIEEKIKE